MSTLTLSDIQNEIKVDAELSKRTEADWETQIKYRGIDVKFDEPLADLIPMYVAKIGKIREELDKGVRIDTSEPMTKEQYAAAYDERLAYLEAKCKRLTDKLSCCLKEQQLRKDGLVERTPHHTLYYIDYTNGNDANDGLSADNSHSWKTINKYTTTTVRTAGDIAYVRANQTHDCSGADIIFDEDGTIDAYISIIGCDATVNDPWSDDSDVKPIIDFGDAAYGVTFGADDYWYLHRLDFRQSNKTSYAVCYLSHSYGIVLSDCVFRDGNATSVRGVFLASSLATITGCSFQDTYGDAIRLTTCYCTISNCTIDAGSEVGATYGINCYSGATAWVTDSTIAPTNAFSSYETGCQWGSYIYARNVTFGVSADYEGARTGRQLYEDYDGTFESQVAVLYMSQTITRETASPRSGGADSYAKMCPDAFVGLLNPMVFGDPMSGFAQVWLTKDIEKTITVYARVGSAWDSALLATEAYLTASYLSNASTAARTTVQSTQQIANDTTWTAFTVTFTPLQTGFVYLWFSLAEYEDATEYIDVDILPVVS